MLTLLSVIDIVSSSTGAFNLPVTLLVSLTVLFIIVALLIYVSTSWQGRKHMSKEDKERKDPPRIIKLKDRYDR